MGTLLWTTYRDDSTHPYGFHVSRVTDRKVGAKGFSQSKYSQSPSGFFEDKSIFLNSREKSIYIIDSSYTDAKILTQSLQGQILYYELETPVETIIDDYDLIDYKVSDFGTEEIIVDEPTTPIIIDVVYGVNAVDTLRRLPQNYISADSMRGFLAQLGSAMGGNWTMEYDEINSKWTFTFTTNQVVNNEEWLEL